MSQHDTLTQALLAYEKAMEGLFTHCLSNGVFNAWGAALDCRELNDARQQARAALSATQPAQAKQSEPAEHWHRLYLEKCQQYNDRVAQLGGVIEGLEAQAAQGVGDKVFLVATGEIYEGQETYERYEGSPPPLCDYEVLYTVPQPAVAQGASEVFTALADHCPVDNGWFNGRAAQGEPVRHVGDSKFESWYQAHPKAIGGDKQLARDAYAAGMFDPVAQGAGEVAAWQASDGGSSYISNEARSRNSAFRELYTIPLYTQPASGADVPPAQPAPVVPDGWKLVPIKCTEAMKDVGGQFEFATISDGRLLAQSMWNELLCATPTPPAQAAADARDAERYRWLRDQANTSVNIDIGAGCEISDTLDAAIDAVLATHQQRQDGVTVQKGKK